MPELTPEEALDLLVKTNISPENIREPEAIVRRALLGGKVLAEMETLESNLRELPDWPIHLYPLGSLAGSAAKIRRIRIVEVPS